LFAKHGDSVAIKTTHNKKGVRKKLSTKNETKINKQTKQTKIIIPLLASRQYAQH